MPYPAGTYINQILDPAVRAEFEQMYSLFQGYLSQQHKDTGAHSAVTADSVSVGATVSLRTTGLTIPSASTANFADTDPAIRMTVPSGHLGLLGAEGGSSRELYLLSQYTGTGTKPCNVTIEAQGGFGADTGHLGIGSTGAVGGSFMVVTADTVSYAANGLGDPTAITVTGSVAMSTTRMTGRITPPQITSNQNDYNPTGLSTASRLYINSDAARDITGIVGQSDGRLLWLVNTGGFTITLKNASASSTAGNQIVAANAADVALRGNNGSAMLLYSTHSGTGYWYVLGA